MPFAYWPLWEGTGTVAECIVYSAQNGTYNSDVSGWPPGIGIGDGNTALYFDGTNDQVNILTASLQSAFDGDTGTICAWCRVLDSTIWPDVFTHSIMGLKAPGDNWIYFQKDASPLPDELLGQRGAGGIVGLPYTTTITSWFYTAFTWDEGINELSIFVNGDQVAGSAAALSAFTGTLNGAQIGARAVGGVRWNGWLAHVALWSRVLSPVEIASFGTV